MYCFRRLGNLGDERRIFIGKETLMATFTVTVTRNTNSGAYTWTWGNSQAINCNTNVATVPANTTGTITVNIQSGTLGDSVVFDFLTPVKFTNGSGGSITPPAWYSCSGGGTSTITITDTNTNSPSATDTYTFFLHSSYTPSGEKAASRDSPDPTIINTGTGGDRCYSFPLNLPLEAEKAA